MHFAVELGKSKNATLILVTNGGDADAAYKIGRYLQDKYDSLGVLLPGLCKSAGTLLAISGKELIFTPYGELGPLDVQIRKEDKLGALESGLNISEAFAAMEERANDTYHRLISEVLTASNAGVSIKTALNAASEMVSSLYGPIFAQIDPEEVGSRSRAIRVAEDYAKRLNLKWENLKKNSIGMLSRSYPEHSFVIDFNEAKLIFERVRYANQNETEIVKRLKLLARFQEPEPIIKYLDKQGNFIDEDSERENRREKSGKRSNDNEPDTGTPS